jgi:uncharacterized protein (TIGR02145 family)
MVFFVCLKIPEKRNNQKMKNKQKKRKRKHLIWVAATIIALSSIGTVGALNGWFGGGGSVPEDTVTLQLMGYWNFDEGSGSTAYDSSGQGKHGQLLTVFSCGDDVTFTYKGSEVTYGTVSSQGECWMDRNLGADQVATMATDTDAYGDLFQWGRLDDQHQTRTSGTQTGLSSTDVPGHSNFIYGMASPYDWRSPQNDNLWQGVSGINNPCPSGWRIPTEAEWEAERVSWTGGNNYTGAFASPLKLTAGGYRNFSDASLFTVGTNGRYWSSTVDTTGARRLLFYVSNATMNSNLRANGFSVRCVQD